MKTKEIKVKDRIEEIPVIYVEMYAVLHGLKIAKEYAEKGVTGNDLIEPLEDYVMNLYGYTEKDIIMRYDKDYLMSCYEDWEEEYK